jgi:hypothetical protein
MRNAMPVLAASPSPGASRRPLPKTLCLLLAIKAREGERAETGTTLPSPLEGEGGRQRRPGEGEATDTALVAFTKGGSL